MRQIKDNVLGAMSQARNDINDRIVSGIKAFLAHHSTKGQRVKAEQDAVDAILVASTFELDYSTSKSRVASALGLNRDAISKAYERAQEMISNRLPFIPKVRKTRSDCYRDAARACIHKFCHLEEASNVDTESYRVYNETENHPARVWNESTMNKRYQSFRESSVYQRFQDQSLGKMRTISREVFRQEVCECIRDPSPQSCVDLRTSALGVRHLAQLWQRL